MRRSVLDVIKVLPACLRWRTVVKTQVVRLDEGLHNETLRRVIQESLLRNLDKLACFHTFALKAMILLG